MKKKLVNIMVCAIGSAVFSTASIAQEYMFTYSKLYSQLKNNAKEGHEDVKVGFFFVNADDKSLCNIEKVWMEKQGKYEELPPVNGKEVVVPLDSNLKSANPLVFVRTPMDMRCDFSMVVMTKQPLSDKVHYQDIEKLLPQMQSMLEDLGGMFASWFTPDVEGLTLEFPESTSGTVGFSNGLSVDIVEHKARIRLADLKPGEYIELPATTSRVLPWLPAAK
ncbi:DUF2987 domain-containing protein [Vibrio sp. MA40-2]|uniref:DUF2987 domain-containing protein n=1 Tax=Vibrio sp. MA40-2 TaxID=3391828 RepID=UPI0039A59043